MRGTGAAAARREYKRKWAKANPDKVKAQQERYWTKKAEQQAQEQQEEKSEDKDDPAPKRKKWTRPTKPFFERTNGKESTWQN